MSRATRTRKKGFSGPPICGGPTGQWPIWPTGKSGAGQNILKLLHYVAFYITSLLLEMHKIHFCY